MVGGRKEGERKEIRDDERFLSKSPERVESLALKAVSTPERTVSNSDFTCELKDD